MKRGTTKFYAACWRELMRFLIETVADDEKKASIRVQWIFLR